MDAELAERIKLAEAIGWTISAEWPNWWISPEGKPNREKGWRGLPNPRESWDDCMAAVDILFPESNLTIQTFRTGGFHVSLHGRDKDNKVIPEHGEYQAFGKTRKDAICAALLKYLDMRIKEPK